MTRPVLVLAYAAAVVVWWHACGLFFSGVTPPASESGQHIQLLPVRFAAASQTQAAGSSIARGPAAKASAAVSAPQAAASGSQTFPGAGAVSVGVATAAAVPEWAAGLHKEIALDNPACPPTRRPFHTLLTGQGTTYNGWQSRIMYYHWRKQRAADGECTEMTGFTRLCASEGGLPDPAAPFIPSVFVPSLPASVLAKYGHFGVLNRPHSVVEFFRRPEMVARVKERYVLVAETDHVLMQPMPNLAQADPPLAAAHSFGYMHPGSRHDPVIRYCWPEGDYSSLQPVGPSPLLIETSLLREVAEPWLNCSFILRGRPEPAVLIQDWVLEMWAYTIAAASLGIRHKVSSLQIEPNAYAGTHDDFHTHHYIFHYTYGIEYALSGRPQGYNTIGEWSMDKRHYGGSYPPRELDPPPAGANPSTAWLHRAWVEAIQAAGDTWPASNAMGTVGWRREGATAAEISASPLATSVLGTHWTWAGIKTLSFLPAGALKTPWGSGKWGVAHKPRGMPECDPPRECLYIDFSGAAHHAAFELSRGEFKSVRVGDGEVVIGKKL